MSNHYSRIPVRYLPSNQDMIKSMDAGQAEGNTDYVNDTKVGTVAAGVQSSYRTPSDRVNGNVMFRRYLDGSLDMEYACHQVIDAVHRAKYGAAPLYTQEQVALEILFPASFSGEIDPLMAASVAAVNLSLIPEEQAMIRAKVAAHLAEEMNYNAGNGGGSVPGRSSTRTA